MEFEKSYNTTQIKQLLFFFLIHFSFMIHSDIIRPASQWDLADYNRKVK